MSETQMFFVISYDISDDKRRRKVASTMEDYGRRVQYSVFECRLTRNRFQALYKKLVSLCIEPEDSIRIYSLCERCSPRVRIIGKIEELPEDQAVIII